jgi:mRNA interferase MazF
MIRGEIWWADFGIPSGSEAGFRQPVLIVQDMMLLMKAEYELLLYYH